MQKEVEDALLARLDADMDVALLARLVNESEQPYELIKFIVKEVKVHNYNTDNSLEKNFDKWKNKFDEEHNISFTLMSRKKYHETSINAIFMSIGEFFGKVVKGFSD